MGPGLILSDQFSPVHHGYSSGLNLDHDNPRVSLKQAQLAMTTNDLVMTTVTITPTETTTGCNYAKMTAA